MKPCVPWLPRILLLALTTLSGCISTHRSELLQRAEENTRHGNYDEAIKAYQQHIKERLSAEERATWENPYFYLLAIGDIQLKQGKYDDAIKSFEIAEAHQIDPLLVSDRYRYVASLYEKDHKLKEAIDILTRYRDRDPLLYDLVRDRLAKELLEEEDREPKDAPPKP